jgi:hypothetical protein
MGLQANITHGTCIRPRDSAALMPWERKVSIKYRREKNQRLMRRVNLFISLCRPEANPLSLTNSALSTLSTQSTHRLLAMPSRVAQKPNSTFSSPDCINSSGHSFPHPGNRAKKASHIMWSKRKQQTKLCCQETYTQGVLRLLPSPLKEKRQGEEKKKKRCVKKGRTASIV